MAQLSPKLSSLLSTYLFDLNLAIILFEASWIWHPPPSFFYKIIIWASQGEFGLEKFTCSLKFNKIINWSKSLRNCIIFCIKMKVAVCRHGVVHYPSSCFAGFSLARYVYLAWSMCIGVQFGRICLFGLINMHRIRKVYFCNCSLKFNKIINW